MRRSPFFVYSLLAVLTIFAQTIVPAATAQRFTVSTIPVPTGANSLFVSGQNQFGDVTGFLYDSAETCAFLYSKGKTKPICSLVNGQGGAAGGINDFRQIAGGSDNHGFIYSKGSVTEIGLLPQGTFSGVGPINNYAQATGQADTDPNPYQGNAGRSHAILYSYSDGKLIDLGVLAPHQQSYGVGINNLGQVTGWGDVPTTSGPYGLTYHAFLYSEGKLMDIGGQPGWFSSGGTAINDFSQVLGVFSGSDYISHTFIYQNGKVQDLGTQIFPSALNNFADIVGTDDIVSPYMTVSAALYSDGVVQDLNTLVPAGTPFYIESAVGINDSGQIIGVGTTADGSAPAYILTPICDRRQYKISKSDLEKNEHWCLAAKGIRIVPPTASFGDVEVGTTSQSITVTGTNTSDQPIVFLGANGSRDFSLDAGTCHLKNGRDGLAAGDSCTFTVSFSPAKTREYKGRIWLSTSAGRVDFHLSGTGID